jgi:site-specific DNA-cytosine methylase
VNDIIKEVRVGHLCCGSGFGAKGFRKGNARVGNLVAKFRNIGGVDVDPAGIRDFERFAGVKGTLLDLMSLEQYRAFHGREPAPGWREATTDDIRAAMGYERPHIWFISAPCKGFSGLLSEKASASAKYQALNGLTLRAVWLALEAYKDDPAEFILFENVPRIANRGRPLLRAIQALYEDYGYAYAETTHDCGELGGLGQSRKRFLMVARHREKVPPFLYEPPKRRLRGVGEILDRLPMPGDDRAGPMHRMPALHWKTWVRLAFVEAGSDWRSLNKLKVEGGMLADFGIAPDDQWRGGVLGVHRWEDTSGTIAGRNGPTNGAFSVADPRAPAGAGEYGQYGVRAWDETMGAVINVKSPGQGGFAVADPRTGFGPATHHNILHVHDWSDTGKTVTGGTHPSGGGLCVADPRAPAGREGSGKYKVTAYGDPAGSVIGASTTGQGAFAVADPRPKALNGEHRDGYSTQGHYGVVPWDRHSGAVPAFAKNNNGPWSVADPRDMPSELLPGGPVAGLPAENDKLVAVIRALDGTWHRPFTTLELAALQSLFDPDEWFGFEMDGSADSAWRERIGNAVPPDAAAAVAGVMGRTLLLAWAGESFMLSSDPIWVQPLTVGLSVDVPRSFEAAE